MPTLRDIQIGIQEPQFLGRVIAAVIVVGAEVVDEDPAVTDHALRLQLARSILVEREGPHLYGRVMVQIAFATNPNLDIETVTDVAILGFVRNYFTRVAALAAAA